MTWTFRWDLGSVFLCVGWDELIIQDLHLGTAVTVNKTICILQWGDIRCFLSFALTLGQKHFGIILKVVADYLFHVFPVGFSEVFLWLVLPLYRLYLSQSEGCFAFWKALFFRLVACRRSSVHHGCVYLAKVRLVGTLSAITWSIPATYYWLNWG